jgi:RNA polymerase sigma factor (sigma-70 family)
VEVTALKPGVASGLRGASPLLRLQPDERLIALTRRGQHAAFEALFSRYHTRLLSFCRHMLGSREDAEDVLQEVFAAAFNAVLADERPINVRPWLYRIARNRSLNHLRRASAIGVDSMDIHFAEHGLSTGDQVLRRESFHQLVGDVQKLPETQRTALLLREIDALSYEQIALAMDTTVPSVKSLLVRARISLAEAAEARKLSCEEVRAELGEVAEGLVKVSAPARRHMRDCERCRTFRKLLKDNNHALAAVFPVGPLLLLKRMVLSKLGASAGAGHAAGGAGVGAAGGAGSGVGAAGGLLTAGAGASAGAAGGASAAGGLVTAGAGAIATKAAATLAAAALLTAGAVAASHPSRVRHHTATAHAVASTSSPAEHAAPLVVRSLPQPLSTGASAAAGVHVTVRLARRRAVRRSELAKHGARPHSHPLSLAADPPATPPAALPATKPPAPPAAVVQVTTETTQLPATPTTTTPTPAADPPATSTTTNTTTTSTTATPSTATPPPAEPAPAATPTQPTPTGAPTESEAPSSTGESGTGESQATTTNPTEAPNGGVPSQ